MNNISSLCCKVSKGLTIQLYPVDNQEHQMQKGKTKISKKAGRVIEDCLRALKERGLTMYLLTLVWGLLSWLIL